MNLPKRPSAKEIDGKLSEAKQALASTDGLFADPGKAAAELNDLNIDDSAEVWTLLRKLLPEISRKHYTGARPPLKSYEKSIEGRDLFAFSWASTEMGKKMYLKFAIKDECFYYVSLHEDRPLNLGETR